MTEHSHAPRWPLVLTFVFAATTALLLGAAIAEGTDGRGLLLLCLVSFVAFVAVGGIWAFSLRPDRNDALAERAETASKMAHELKNPLMSIKGLAGTGMRLFDSMSEEERREFFMLIDDEAGRLKTIAEHMATAMKIDADRLTYDLREEDLGALVEEIAWDAPHGGHPMVVETEPDVTVLVDRVYLDEAITNLIDNASKFSPPDAPIEVRAFRDEDGDAVVEVADRGPGIPDERRREVFRKFAAWRPAGYEETPGAGLGLFVARAHVLAHGGQIEADDRDDGGTMLRLTLPAER